MDALSLIDRGTQTVDTVAPAKTKNKNEQQFGGVLNEKRQAQESESAEKKTEIPTNSKDNHGIAHNHKTEIKQKDTGQKESAPEAVVESGIPVVEGGIRAETIPQQQAKVQQALVDLMKTVAEDKSSGVSESFEQIEELLTDLVQQLETTELPGEQVLAGVDLSSLAAELETLNNDGDRKELLAQLVTAIEEQLTDEPGLLENGELAATMVVDPQLQNVAPVVMENLAQARQLLQKALDSVVSQKSVVADAAMMDEPAAAMDEPAVAMDEPAKEVDPRFAGLLNPRSELRTTQQPQSAKEQIPLHNSRQPADVNQSEAAVQAPTAEITPKVETTQLSGGGSKQVFENMVQQTQHSLQSQGQPLIQGLETNKAAPQTPVVQLASGLQVAESQIFDQVVTHLSGSVNGESGRMVLRLQPAELGSLRLELTVEGDRIQAHLHAQSHQVQEVLERNLPQLRNALAEQGLKIDQFQVNVDQRQQSGQFENLAQQHQHNGSEKQPGWHQQNLEPEEQFIPLAHLMQNGGGGINLHV